MLLTIISPNEFPRSPNVYFNNPSSLFGPDNSGITTKVAIRKYARLKNDNDRKYVFFDSIANKIP